jgi:hypothetical protein
MLKEIVAVRLIKAGLVESGEAWVIEYEFDWGGRKTDPEAGHVIVNRRTGEVRYSPAE